MEIWNKILAMKQQIFMVKTFQFTTKCKIDCWVISQQSILHWVVNWEVFTINSDRDEKLTFFWAGVPDKKNST